MALNPRIPDWRGQHVWLVGASTGIGRAAVAKAVREGALVLLLLPLEAPQLPLTGLKYQIW